MYQYFKLEKAALKRQPRTGPTHTSKMLTQHKLLELCSVPHPPEVYYSASLTVLRQCREVEKKSCKEIFASRGVLGAGGDFFCILRVRVPSSVLSVS